MSRIWPLALAGLAPSAVLADAPTGGQGLCPSPAHWTASWAPEAAAAMAEGQRMRREAPLGRGRQAELPVRVEADRLSGTPGQESLAEGSAILTRGPVTLRADRISYQPPTDQANAEGQVFISRDGNLFRGRSLSLQLDRYQGEFLEPSYFFARTQAGGDAKRFVFLGERQGRAESATYSSCPPSDPAWVMSADQVDLDFDTNEGVARGAVLRFQGVPILAAPRLSFPLTEQRKTGWLPPTVNLDSKSGLDLQVPFYWNIAPERDLTLIPRVYSRRGAGLAGEYRYLGVEDRGVLEASLLPGDRLADRDRWLTDLRHLGRLGAPLAEPERRSLLDYRLRVLRASDDDYWKDFSRTTLGITPRLLPSEAAVAHRRDGLLGEITYYGRVQRFQVLQGSDVLTTILSPYHREPQVGVRQAGRGAGFEWRWELEANRFVNPAADLVDGNRVHLLGSVARPFRPLGSPGWTVTPRLSLNSATYDLDGRGLGDGSRRVSRTIPTASLDSLWIFERDATLFGREVLQTVEPRLQYVRTPFRAQDDVPIFDSAPNDFNIVSIFAENTFSGVDRVSDANQLTAGLTTRFLSTTSGAEALRLGAVQRVLFSDQRITPDGRPLTQRLSDLLLLGSTSIVPNWSFDGTLQYSPQTDRVVRQVLGLRYSPGPLRTVNAAYRFNRDATDQIQVGWQWPLNDAGHEHAAAMLARDQAASERGESNLLRFGTGRSGAGCAGAWYSVGNVRYSRRDDRVTDALLGLEYDSGCWIARVVAERLSTGRTEATTRLLLQLELVGLSRLGSNPLSALRDSIPGYRPLRDEAPSLGSQPMNPP